MARTIRGDRSARQEAEREARRKARQKACQKGLSLIEMMSAIGIMAIVLAIALPAFGSWRQSTALQSATQTLMAHIKQARLMAVAGNRTVRVLFATDRYTVDSGGDHEQQYPLSRYSDALVFSDVSFSGNTLTFRSRGVANFGHVVLQNGDGTTHKITVNILGRAYD